MDDLRLDPVLLKDLIHLIESDRRIAILSGASVDNQNLHLYIHPFPNGILTVH
jgi:hypothetical protein